MYNALAPIGDEYSRTRTHHHATSAPLYRISIRQFSTFEPVGICTAANLRGSLRITLHLCVVVVAIEHIFEGACM